MISKTNSLCTRMKQVTNLTLLILNWAAVSKSGPRSIKLLMLRSRMRRKTLKQSNLTSKSSWEWNRNKKPLIWRMLGITSIASLMNSKLFWQASKKSTTPTVMRTQLSSKESTRIWTYWILITKVSLLISKLKSMASSKKTIWIGNNSKENLAAWQHRLLNKVKMLMPNSWRGIIDSLKDWMSKIAKETPTANCSTPTSTLSIFKVKRSPKPKTWMLWKERKWVMNLTWNWPVNRRGSLSWKEKLI